jgi:hypothetical protein
MSEVFDISLLGKRMSLSPGRVTRLVLGSIVLARKIWSLSQCFWEKSFAKSGIDVMNF